ncbi:MAG: hypothetical protein WCJ64_05940 [Rhodospirillaceae bacterium]
MLNTMARAIAAANGAPFETDRDRYRRLALAALKPLGKPTKGMIYAAHAAVEFDAMWAINTNQDFARAAKAMIKAVVEETELAFGQGDNPAEECYPPSGRRR